MGTRDYMNKLISHIAMIIATQYYMKIIYEVKDDECASDYIYDLRVVSEDQTHDAHIFHFPENIDISIQYSIPIIRLLAVKENEKYISFEQLKERLAYDTEQSKEVLDEIRQLITDKREHEPASLVIMYYIPHKRWLLLDGRHRFIEYEKFDPNAESVPILEVDSKMLLPAIINKSGFIACCIQHNIDVLDNYPIWTWRKNLLNIRGLLRGDAKGGMKMK